METHPPHSYRTLGSQTPATGGTPIKYSQLKAGTELYDLEKDPGEKSDLASLKPEIVAELQEHVEKARNDLGDALTGRSPTGARPAGKLTSTP
jgi:hypothetical protein